MPPVLDGAGYVADIAADQLGGTVLPANDGPAVIGVDPAGHAVCRAPDEAKRHVVIPGAEGGDVQ